MSAYAERWYYWVPGLVFLLLGAGALALVELDHRRMSDHLHHAVAAADNLGRVRLHLAEAYLGGGRGGLGDPTFDRIESLSALDEGIRLLDDWLEGRSTLLGIRAARPRDPELQGLGEEYRRLILAFRGELERDPVASPVVLRVSHDAADRAAQTLERTVHQRLRADIAEERESHHVRLLGWAGLVLLGSGGVLFFGEARRRAVTARMDTERRYGEIVENAPVGIAETTVEGGIRAANDAFAEILGYASARALLSDGPDLFEDVYVDPEDRHRIVAALGSHGTVQNEEVRWRTREGRKIWVRLAGVAQRPTGEPDRYLAFVEDITRERSLEEQLSHSQKMEALGTLAGGMAHDFNNLFTPILVNTDLVAMALDEDHPALPDLREIRAATDRGTELTRRILAFSRHEEFETRLLDLNEVVRGMEGMLRRTIPADVALEFALAPNPCWARSDYHQLEQAVMNLVVNARDAMPDGGTIELETRPVELDERYAADHVDVAPGAYVVLDVSDTGHGMDDATRQRIFDPFFTTKAADEGTGLGLSSVYGTVNRSRGYIRVYSEPGHGATFRIYLPRATSEGEPEQTSSRPAPATEVSGDGRVATVLVAEDDALVRRAAVRALRAEGHTVLEASNAPEALDLLERHGEGVGLLLTDVVMPGTSGADLAGTAREGLPRLRVLFMSGYTERSIERRSSWLDGSLFVRKPFTADGLVRAVREALRD